MEHNKQLFLVFFIIAIQQIANAEYVLSKDSPIEYPPRIKERAAYLNHNFGEYRGQPGYKYHDGLDYYIPPENRVSHMPVYPVSAGTAHVHPQPVSEIGKKKGWGNCVIVDHGAFQTRYAHLSGFEVTEGQIVDTSTILGLSGNTGASDYEHLHFSIGNNGLIKNALSPANTENPILVGLKQPQYGNLEIKANPKGFNIRLLSTGKDGSFGGDNEVITANENDVINIPKPNQPLKAVVEAYHFTGRHNSNPYKIEIEVEKISGPADFAKVNRDIIFDNIANINRINPPPYSLSKPYITDSIHDYYGVEFTPTAGKYKITAKIYSCYRDNSGFHLTTPSISDGTLVEREITVGLNGANLDWHDPTISYAWLPDDIAGGGAIMPASVPGGGIRATAVAPEGPEIFYAFANNNIVTTNMLDVDENLQKKAIIESRTRNKSNWTIRFKCVCNPG